MKIRKILTLLLVCVLLLQLPLAACAVSRDAERDIQKMLNYYRYYQTDAEEAIDSLILDLKSEDWTLGLAWEKMMNTWQYVDQSMPVSQGVLPYGLPQDDSLAIVVMGYALNANGTMRSEMEDRLIVALASAQRYPNAYIICTGGATARYSSNTEAGVMANWLKEQGVSASRIITETKSYSTTANAQNTYKILTESYPQIKSLAVISSDYHIYRSVLAFQAMSDYASTVNGTAAIPVVANACCWTSWNDRESLTSQAEVLAMIGGLELDYQSKPALSSGSTSAPAQPSYGNNNWQSSWETNGESYWEGYVPPVDTGSKPQEDAWKDTVVEDAPAADSGNVPQNPWLPTDFGTVTQPNDGGLWE